MNGLLPKRIGFVVLLLAALTVWLIMFTSRAGAAQGTLQLQSATTGLGQDAEVALSAVDVGSPGLGAWTVDVAYDPAILALVSCQAEQGGICNGAFGNGVLRVTGVSATGLAGTTELARMTFNCLAGGASALTSSIDVFSDATPGAPQPVDTIVDNGTITCTSEPQPPTPTPTSEPTAPPPGSDAEKLPGDADCDGDVDAVDATYVLQVAAELLDELACADNADANHDGVIGPIDATIILQTAAGLL